MEALYRTVDGLLFQRNRYGLSRSDFITSEWDVPDAHVTLQVLDGRLRIIIDATGTYPNFVRCNVVASRAESFVWGRITAQSNTRIGITSHINDISVASADGVMLTIPAGFTASALLQEYIAGTPTTRDSLAGQTGTYGPYSFWLHSDGNTIAGKDSLTNRAWAGTTTNQASGQVGLWHTNVSTAVLIYDYFVSTGRYLTVTDLATDDSIEIRDNADVVYAIASESGGTATIDMMGVDCTSAQKIVLVRGGIDYATYQQTAGYHIVGGNSYSLIAKAGNFWPVIMRMVDQQRR